MSVRVIEHTARKPGKKCVACTGEISVGDTYRRIVAVQEDWANEAFMTQVAHAACVSDVEFWALRALAEERREQAARLRQMNRFRGTNFQIGQRVEVDGKPGVVSGAEGANLLVKLDGVKHPMPWHPTWRVKKCS